MTKLHDMAQQFNCWMRGEWVLNEIDVIFGANYICTLFICGIDDVAGTA